MRNFTVTIVLSAVLWVVILAGAGWLLRGVGL